jgi:hypothetical protein
MNERVAKVIECVLALKFLVISESRALMYTCWLLLPGYVIVPTMVCRE